MVSSVFMNPCYGSHLQEGCCVLIATREEKEGCSALLLAFLDMFRRVPQRLLFHWAFLDTYQ